MFKAPLAKRPQRAAPAATTVKLGEPGIVVSIKRSASARRFTLRVRAANRVVVLTMPAQASLNRAKDFALRHLAWIEARLTHLPPRIRFEPGALIPLRGIEHLVTHRPGARRIVWVEASHDQTPPMLLCVSGEPQHIQRRVTDYLKRAAKRDFEAAVSHHSATVRRAVHSITLRDTTSRWGSCSSRGSLNFSWRLILAPGYVLDYLAAHEVAHLVHMDHSAAFWRLAETLAPRLNDAEAWLKAHGAGLHRFGG